jgi:hypothetical protein
MQYQLQSCLLHFTQNCKDTKAAVANGSPRSAIFRNSLPIDTQRALNHCHTSALEVSRITRFNLHNVTQDDHAAHLRNILFNVINKEAVL